MFAFLERFLDASFWHELLIASGIIFTVLKVLGIFFFFYILGKFFTNIILKAILKLTEKTKTTIDNQLVKSFKRPIKILFYLLGIYFAISYLPLTPKQDLLLVNFFRSGIVFIIAMGLYNFVSDQENFVLEIETILKTDIDRILVPLITKASQVIIIFLAIVIIAQEWDYDVNGFIAGLGLGGLAFALAAQETLSNLFGGIVIITDKPFSIGDWILTSSVEGNVEDINFRSTRVRTFDQALVTVPNAKLASDAITNWSRMGKRRLNFLVGATYETSKEQLENCVLRIREMLSDEELIDDETINVSFDSFGDSSLDISIYCFTKETSRNEYVRAKEVVNYKIMEIFEEEGVSMAFPSTSIYFENKLETINAKNKEE